MSIFQTIALEDLLDTYIGGLWGEEPGRSEVDVKVMRITELGANGESDLTTSATRSLTLKQVASRKLLEGDLVLEKSGGGPKTPVGRVALIGSLTQDVICSNFMLLMRPNKSRALSGYLHHFLTYLHVTGQTIPLQSSSTNIRNISTPDYMQIQVPVPPLDEQRRIVETLDDQLSRLDKALAELDLVDMQTLTLRRSILNHLLYPSTSNSKSGVGHMSQSFSTSKLGEVADFVMGQAPPSAETNAEGIGTPFVQVRNFGSLIPRIEEWTTKPLKMASEGDVLVCIVGATVGKVNLGIEAAITRSIAAVRPRKGLLDQKYLYFWMSFNMLQLRSQSSGSAQGVISKEQLATLEIPLPPLEEQRLIVENLDNQLSRLDSSRAYVASQKSKLQTLRRSILHKAFSGQ